MENKVVIAAYAVVIGGFIGVMGTIGLSLPKGEVADQIVQPNNVYRVFHK